MQDAVTAKRISFVQDDGRCHVFTDASFSERTNKIGLAWIIALKGKADEIVLTQALPPEDGIRMRYQNKVGEVMAAIRALESVPAPADIHLHTDFMDTITTINGTESTALYQDVPTPLLEELKKAAAQHNSVIASYARDNESAQPYEGEAVGPHVMEMMILAHMAAAEASGSRNIAPMPEHLEQRYHRVFGLSARTPDERPKPRITQDMGDAWDVITIGDHAGEEDINWDDPLGPIL